MKDLWRGLQHKLEHVAGQGCPVHVAVVAIRKQIQVPETKLEILIKKRQFFFCRLTEIQTVVVVVYFTKLIMKIMRIIIDHWKQCCGAGSRGAAIFCWSQSRKFC